MMADLHIWGSYPNKKSVRKSMGVVAKGSAISVFNKDSAVAFNIFHSRPNPTTIQRLFHFIPKLFKPDFNWNFFVIIFSTRHVVVYNIKNLLYTTKILYFCVLKGVMPMKTFTSSFSSLH